jgi:adenylate kinase
MRIILLGAPGSGKGTLGEKLEGATGFPRISTGDILRRAVREGTPLGKQAAAIMAKGDLVGDEIVTGLVRERIALPDCRNGYILDGYPRTIAQAEALSGLDGGRPEIVLALEVRDETVVARLGGRRVCGACATIFNVAGRPSDQIGPCEECGGPLQQRLDDSEAVVRDRLRVYREATAPLAGYYKGRSTYHALDGEGRPEDVFRRAAAVLDAERKAAGERKAR